MSVQADAAVVARMAHLARLQLSETEMIGIARDLSAILGYIDTLQSVDTSGVAPMRHAAEHGTPLRADVAEPGLSAAQVLGNAPAVQDGCFAVPRVVGQGS